MGKAILFDLDGTLWDSSEQVTEAWNLVFEREGVPVRLTGDDMRRLMGRTMDEIALAVFPEDDRAYRERMLDACCREENEYLRLHGAVLYPGLRETLEALAREHGLFIVSNCQTGYIEAFLEAHDLAPLFRDHECFGRTGRGKAENIRILLERQGARDAVYVGDTAGDEASAAAAGIPFIHAAYGFGKAESPAAVIRRITELPEALKALENR
ncbi:MAG: HAD family hydrolase [Oscillospiraceae bacterium]|nr:HAD family hydrolase [Oscillospiraceae bacterium]